MSNDNPVSVKKVQPYPIECGLTGGASPLRINIIKLTTIGFLADVGPHVFEVGNGFHAQFILPVFNKSVISPVKVIKTYDSYGGKEQGTVVNHIVEMHFLSLPESHKEAIRRFLLAIKQV